MRKLWQDFRRVLELNREYGKKGFSLIELLVVIAIIAILAAIAIPQYNKYRTNAMLSNVQALAKHLASDAFALGTTAGQNPACRYDNTFVVLTINGTQTADLNSTKDSADNCDPNNDCTLVALRSDNKTLCDYHIYRANKDLPSWVETVNATLTITTEGGVVKSEGSVTVTSSYSLGGGNYIGCTYNPQNDTLTDAGGSYYCRIK